MLCTSALTCESLIQIWLRFISKDLAFSVISIHPNAGPFVIAAGVILGVSAGLLWTAQGSIMLAYPTEGQKGVYISVFWAIFNLGGVVGAAVSLGQNFHSKVCRLLSPSNPFLITRSSRRLTLVRFIHRCFAGRSESCIDLHEVGDGTYVRPSIYIEGVPFMLHCRSDSLFSRVLASSFLSSWRTPTRWFARMGPKSQLPVIHLGQLSYMDYGLR
jgi:hypothetical protein